ncbi:saccharopine dehydrogenase family protein [Cohnella mopanensis]|uniref:saccharopine dehydrogenase family protein n=1 Tax=Cohnella mopanensis TaxID=2911966 RepID=UPI001EF95927|nr:saccharopine dehydrogenase NADP-binding domain-containing protein [Cohnella mopanensis]
MAKDRIMVIGGYGTVGSTICTLLGKKFPGKIIAAGRSYDKAARFCQQTGNIVLPMRLDIELPVEEYIFNGVKLVIMCLDQPSTRIAQMCLELGIHYIDISADISILSQIENQAAHAREFHATAVLSVGLAPGLTNLLAKKAIEQLDEIREIRIYNMLGLGEQHGDAAIDWTLDHLQTGFQRRRKTNLGKGIGRRTAYSFDFSDQHVLPVTLQVTSVTTYLIFDSAVVTTGLALMKRMRLMRILKYKFVSQWIKASMKRIRMGSDKFVIKVEASGKKKGVNHEVECLAEGRNEGDMTARITALIGESVYVSPYPFGVFHIEQLFDLDDVMRKAGEDSVQIRILHSTAAFGSYGDEGAHHGKSGNSAADVSPDINLRG